MPTAPRRGIVLLSRSDSGGSSAPWSSAARDVLSPAHQLKHRLSSGLRRPRASSVSDRVRMFELRGDFCGCGVAQRFQGAPQQTRNLHLRNPQLRPRSPSESCGARTAAGECGGRGRRARPSRRTPLRGPRPARIRRLPNSGCPQASLRCHRRARAARRATRPTPRWRPPAPPRPLRRRIRLRPQARARRATGRAATQAAPIHAEPARCAPAIAARRVPTTSSLGNSGAARRGSWARQMWKAQSRARGRSGRSLSLAPCWRPARGPRLARSCAA